MFHIGNRNRTEYALDAWGRVTEIRRADGSTEQYAYDKEGRLAEKTDKNGVTTAYAFNFYGAPLYRREKGSLQGDFYEYTPEGLLKSAISGRMAYSYTYDAMGRLSKKSASGRTLLSLEYDGNGNLTRQTDVTGKITAYRFDLLDRLTEVWDDGEKLAEYGYYPDGTIQREIHGSLTKEYTYDADRNLTRLNIQCGDSLLADNHYTYDGNGNRLEKQQLFGTTRYVYDALNQLVKAEYPTYGEELFYDRAGNRTCRRSAGVEEVYAYDAGNHLTKLTRNGEDISFQYDRAGNLVKDDKASYTYDAFNRNTRVETFDGNIQINHYDAEGLRAEMEENGRLVQFIFNPAKEVVTETEDKTVLRYIRGSELIARNTDAVRTYYHYASDEMGSITHVTDEEGKLLNHYEYDAWGNLTAEEEQVPNRFKYTGEQFDPITQQYYLRARFYNPALARFMQEDTYRGDGLNLYTYCANNPVIYADPSGHWCDKKEKIYKELVIENGLDINNIDPDTKQRLMAEASNRVKKEKADSSTPRLPGPVITGQNRLPGPVADVPGAQKRKKDEKSINVGGSGHHVPAVRKSKGRPFAVSRSDKKRPTIFFRGKDPGRDHWRLHDAERDYVGPRQGDFIGTADELFDAYRNAYKGLDDIKVDVKSPNGTYILGTDVTPEQAVNLIQDWLKEQGLY